MKEFTIIIDQHTGALTIEGLSAHEAAALAPELSNAVHVNCARPAYRPPLPDAVITPGAEQLGHVQTFCIYHNSVVEGPGRRSVLQMSGCGQCCTGCFVPETWPRDAGKLLPIKQVIELILAPEGEPRDGVTILGGEPFDQPEALATITRELKQLGQHLTLYSGYTLEALRSRNNPFINEALDNADILIDGPFMREETAGAGEWRGSRNQRIIQLTRERL